MRICHVSPHLPPDHGANALLPVQLGRWMAARGDEISYVAHHSRRSGSNTSGDRPGDGPSPIRWVRRRSRSPLLRPLKIDAWRVVRQIRSALDQVASRADLLHLHSNGLIIETAARWARRHRIPYVLTLYGTEIWHYRKRWPFDPFTRAYQRAAQVTFYSQRLLAHARAAGLDRDGSSVVYPPVADAFAVRDEDTRRAWRRSLGIDDRFVILNVKRLHPLAGQRFLLEAFARVREVRDDVRLVICGDGPLRESLRLEAGALGVTNSVTFTGPLPNETIARYMTVADVFALPSVLEALPTVAVEALACGTPVISADHPGGLELREVFGGDVTVVPRETVDPLARALRDFLDRPRRATPATADLLSRQFRSPAVLHAFDEAYAKARHTRS